MYIFEYIPLLTERLNKFRKICQLGTSRFNTFTFCFSLSFFLVLPSPPVLALPMPPLMPLLVHSPENNSIPSRGSGYRNFSLDLPDSQADRRIEKTVNTSIRYIIPIFRSSKSRRLSRFPPSPGSSGPPSLFHSTPRSAKVGMICAASAPPPATIAPSTPSTVPVPVPAPPHGFLIQTPGIDGATSIGQNRIHPRPSAPCPSAIECPPRACLIRVRSPGPSPAFIMHRGSRELRPTRVNLIFVRSTFDWRRLFLQVAFSRTAQASAKCRRLTPRPLASLASISIFNATRDASRENRGSTFAPSGLLLLL
jgi:hypothetical protein